MSLTPYFKELNDDVEDVIARFVCVLFLEVYKAFDTSSLMK